MRIGFIDYYLDEWHADNYPAMIKEHSKGTMEVAFGYGMIASPISGKTSEEWCQEHEIEYCSTIDEVIEKSDALIVLSPDNPEMHEVLSELPLKSGKRTYIDKTFASSKKMAQSIFDLAEKNNTPCYSTSALRYANEYHSFIGEKVVAASFLGPCNFHDYSIHHLEPIIMLIEDQPQKVMAVSKGDWTELLLAWPDGRIVSMICTGGDSPFVINLLLEDKCVKFEIESDYFGGFIDGLIQFFETGEIPVSHQETLRIIAIRDAGLQALKFPGTWIFVD